MSARFTILVLISLGALGLLFAFRRGGLDYDVFATAARWVVSGEPLRMYSDSPDRYLYAPGFAWVFSPFGVLPRECGLLIWSGLKLAALAWVLRPWISSGAGLALLCLARPILIDFQYGQVNLLLLILCIRVAQEATTRAGSASSWFALSVLAWAKIFALPLLLLPWIRGSKEQRIATLAGTLLILGLPLIFVGPGATATLYADWMQAIAARGVPLESHNQSFIAFLSHVFGGRELHVIFSGPSPVAFGWPLLDARTVRELALVASFLVGGVWLARAIRLPRGKAPFSEWAILIGLLIVPLHLVWKPYFVFGLPAALVLFAKWSELSLSRRLALVAILVNFNLSGFDFVGPTLAAWLEASAIFLWLHLALLVLVSATQASTSSRASFSPPARAD